MEDTPNYLTRNDYKILKAHQFKHEANFKKSSGLNDLEPYVDALIRKLADSGRSQAAIAEILNERQILRNGQDQWRQYHISRWMNKNGVKSACDWRGNYERKDTQRSDSETL